MNMGRKGRGCDRLIVLVSRAMRIATVLSAVAGVSGGQSMPPQGLDEYMNKVREQWNVPGIAIAVVKDDDVVFSKGYGVRKIGDSAPVSDQTVFAIASCTKAFTAAALAILVDEHKIGWDDPVTKYLPYFQLYDPYVTNEVTIRDLLGHRTGFGRDTGDFLFTDPRNTHSEILRRLRYLKPSSQFRSAFGYSNVMYLAASEIIPAVTGVSWDEFITMRIFEPLGMASTSTHVSAVTRAANVASPHYTVNGTLQRIPYRDTDPCAGACAIYSSAADMAQWIRLQLGKGKIANKRLYTQAVADEMWSPQTIIPVNAETLGGILFPSTHFLDYGFGWAMHDYLGRKIIRHLGGLDGMTSAVVLVPEEGLGFVLLANRDFEEFNPMSLIYRVLDIYLGAPLRDWSTEFHKVHEDAQLAYRREEQKVEALRVRNTVPTLPLQKYCGAYENDAYGSAVVELEEGKLLLHFNPTETAELSRWHYDTFRVIWNDLYLNTPGGFGQPFATFVLDPNGRVGELRVGELGIFRRLADMD